METNRILRIEEAVAAAAARYPEAPAVEFANERWTHGELLERTRQFAGALHECGVPAGATVGVITTKSPSALALHLGIWTAGAVPAPIDLRMPVPDLNHVLEDYSLHSVIADNDGLARLERAAGYGDTDRWPKRLRLEAVPATLRQVADHGPRRTPPPRDSDPDLCYLFFTSGTTGKPKAIEGRHSSLVQYVSWFAREFAVGPDDSFSQVAPFSFDFSLKEIFPALVSGARVRLIPPAVARDPEAFLDEAARTGVTVMSCIPTTFRMMARAPRVRSAVARVREVIVGGEPLRWEDVRRWREAVGDYPPLVNMYGPTECTATKCHYRVPSAGGSETGSVPVGRPMEGATVLIVGEDGAPVVESEIGEVVIASNWLARGYRAASAGKADAFTAVDIDGVPLTTFRTGDLGRHLPDGNLELVGRADRQLKINGHRVNLDAVEATMMSCLGVQDAVVIGGNPEESLTGFFTVEAGRDAEFDVALLRAHLQERLAAVAVPLRLVRLEALPLTRNGKVDRHTLASQSRTTDRRLDATTLPMMDRVAAAWREVLALNKGGWNEALHDVNFYDLGGTSVLEFRLFQQLREDVAANIGLEFRELLERPTIREQAEWLEHRRLAVDVRVTNGFGKVRGG